MIALEKFVALTEDHVQFIARALADPRRDDILKKLDTRKRFGITPCSAMRECIAISPATLSHHMRELELAGLVAVVREGNFASCTPRPEFLRAFFDRLKSDLTSPLHSSSRTNALDGTILYRRLSYISPPTQ